MGASELPNREEAIAWWRAQVEGEQYVLPQREVPTGPGRAILLRGGYAVEAAGGQAWILKTPQREADVELCLRNYWRLIEAVTANYEPAVVERDSAVRLYLEDATPPERLRIRHAASQSRYTFEICPGLEVQLMAGEVVLDEAKRIRVGGATVPVDRPERTLLSLPLSALRNNVEEAAIWLASLVVARPVLEEEWTRSPRPLVIRRLAELARDAGNRRLADQLDELIATHHGQHISRARTGIGTEVVVPRVVSESRASTPWLSRHAVIFRRFAEEMTEAVRAEAALLPRFDRTELIRQAREAKTYDAYHSTTIEGYRITPEEVSAVIRGEHVAGHDPEDVRARMAVRGYSLAFDRCLEVIGESEGPVRITEGLILDLYADLFTPSVEAGILEPEALRGWRVHPAYLRGARYVPPSHEKVPQLMAQHCRLMDEVMEPAVARAALGHLDFVAVHPFPDGNGRIARFLMNLILVTAGLPWVTIRTDDRVRYFQALETATVGGDARPFAGFVLGYLVRGLDSI